MGKSLPPTETRILGIMGHHGNLMFGKQIAFISGLARSLLGERRRYCSALEIQAQEL
jgi:hypothetical protein